MAQMILEAPTQAAYDVAIKAMTGKYDVQPMITYLEHVVAYSLQEAQSLDLSNKQNDALVLAKGLKANFLMNAAEASKKLANLMKVLRNLDSEQEHLLRAKKLLEEAGKLL